MGVRKEEEIFRGFDKGWGRDLAVLLIQYDSGGMDIHRQTGEQFKEHVAEAEKILDERGLKLDEKDAWMFGSTGAYRRVIKK